jgi:uncharacterized cupin superfamily protein
LQKPSVIKFARHDTNADQMPVLPVISPADLEAGTPVQRGVEYFNDTTLGLNSGVWDCTPMTTRMGPYPFHEFMILLEGSVTIREASGRETVINAGESFILPKDLVCQWHQTGYVRKFYVIFEDPSGTAPRDPASLKVLKIDTNHDLQPSPPTAKDILLSDVPTQFGHNWFEDPTGQWTTGVWGSTPYRRKAMPFPRHELMHLLEGSVTLTDPDLGAQTFTAGDTFFVPKGANVEWYNPVPVKKLYSIFIPKNA